MVRVLDLGVGVYYIHNNWYVGASVQHLNAPLVELGEKNELQIDRTYYLTGGYNIKLRKSVSNYTNFHNGTL